MKRFVFAFLLRLIPFFLFCLLIGYFIAIQRYVVAAVSFTFSYWMVFVLFRFMKRTAKDTKRLIDAIQFSEFNISFQNFARKGLYPDLIPLMEKAIVRFNDRLKHMEMEQHFYDLLLNRIDSPILVIDKMNHIEWINKAAINEFGKPLPRQLSDLATNSPELPVILDKMVPGEVKMIKVNREGFCRPLIATAVHFTSRGKLLKLVSFKNIQPVLEESESEAWKKLIRVLTHEMMNSITPILSLTETLSDPDSTREKSVEVMSRALHTIHRRSKGLVDFVGNYQKLTRIPSPVMMDFSATEMMNDISDLLRAEGIRFSYDIQPEGMFLYADRTLMEQAMINLIRNAWEACSHNPKPDVKVQLSKNEYHKSLIVVSDNGCGILPDVMDKIFVPFFTTKSGGSGIGLSICRQIMISQGGNISVESEHHQGTKVVLSL